MSVIKSDNYANRVGDKSVPAETVVNGTAKAWAVEGGGAFNVSSVTSLGNSNNQYNFSSALLNANYAAISCVQHAANVGRFAMSYNSTTSSTRVQSYQPNLTTTTVENAVSVHGDLA